MQENAALVNYQILCKKVSEKFEQIQKKYSQHLSCGRGCSQCCVRDITVNDVERAVIAAYLHLHPQVRMQLELEKKAGPEENKCEFLLRDRSCAIYESRPIVCRSHGVPLNLSEREAGNTPAERQIDVCPLNFSQSAGQRVLEVLDQNDTINLRTLNTILAVINSQYRGDREMVRYRLTLGSILF